MLPKPPACFVNVVTQLRPGVIDHATVSIRSDLRELGVEDGPGRDELVGALAVSIEAKVSLLENDPVELLANFSDRCLIMGETVQVKMLPRGEALGRVTAVDGDGFLVLESPTGMLERVAPASLRSLHVVETR